ncbi:MAG TPA: hypothetical protein PJ991_12105 [Kiritimatiellia bacterium]|nr:hypothetical protein [Kiritimatiellia bacterium]
MKALQSRSGIVVLAVLAGGLLFVHRLEPWGDAVDYLLMSKALLAGQWNEVLAWRYPPLYPAWIALCSLPWLPEPFGGMRFQLSSGLIWFIKSIGVALYGFAIYQVYEWLKQVVGTGYSLMVVAMAIALNQHLAIVGSLIGSEILFLLLFWGALGSIHVRAAEEASTASHVMKLTMLFSCAILTRSIGLSLVLGFGIWCASMYIMKRKSLRTLLSWWPALVIPTLIFAGTTFLGSSANIQFITTGSDYLALEYDVERTWIGRVVYNALNMPMMLFNLCIPKIVDESGALARLNLLEAAPLLSWSFFLTVAIGVGSTIRNRYSPVHAVAMVYIAVVLMTLDPKGRYFYPLIPIVWWWFVAGLISASSYFRLPWDRAVKFTGIALVGWIASTTLFAGIKNVNNILRYSGTEAWATERYIVAGETDYAGLTAMASWVGRHSEVNDAVISVKAPLVEGISGREVRYIQSYYMAPEKIESLIQELGRNRVIWLLVDVLPETSRVSKSRQVVTGQLKARSEVLFNEVFRYHDNIVYRLQYEPPGISLGESIP